MNVITVNKLIDIRRYIKLFKKTITFILLIIFFSRLNSEKCYSEQKLPIDRFFGFHFDFHATYEDSLIGKDFNYDQINNFFSKIKPDFIQVDVKGHKGYSSYPTNIGARTANYYNDPLKFWQRICEANDIHLYAHYSGLVDKIAATTHPQWTHVDSYGKTSDKVSIFSNYADSLLIPQIEELIREYNFDGVWFDGDGWALEPDYSVAAKNEFKNQYKIFDIPFETDDIYYSQYLNFTRASFLNYLKTISDKIHSIDPSFNITSNWAFSTSMPYDYNSSIDFLSGDLSGTDFIINAAFQSRFFNSYDLPWDLMSWTFSSGSPKPLNLILYEASEIISVGGGFQSYWIQERNASLNSSIFPLMEKLSQFCRKREEYCYNLEIVPQIGILYLKDSWEKNYSEPFTLNRQEAVKGIMTMFLDNKYSVSILRSENKDSFRNYPLLIIPEWGFISPYDKSNIIDYVKEGGNLLILGVDACRNFENELNLKNLKQQLIVKSLGEGKIAGFLKDMGRDYYDNQTSDFFQMINPALENSIIPMVKIMDNRKIHINISKKNDDYYLHLINLDAINYSNDLNQFKSIISGLKNIKIEINLPTQIVHIQECPSNEIINFQRNQNLVSFTLPSLEIYSVIKVTP